MLQLLRNLNYAFFQKSVPFPRTAPYGKQLDHECLQHSIQNHVHKGYQVVLAAPCEGR